MRILFACLFVILSSVQPSFSQDIKLDNPPKDKAMVFMDDFVSNINGAEMCGALSTNHDVFYFNAQHKGNWSIFATMKMNGEWSTPKPLNFSAGYTDRDFTMSPEGNKIYFGSDRPKSQDGKKGRSLDIFVSEKISWDKWTEPKSVGDIINTEFTENYPSVDSEGNLYFFSCRKESNSGCDIYISYFVNNQYITPELLDHNINSDKHDWDSFIAPDGSYIIFSSKDRDDTIGKQDLYISFKGSDGKWSKAINMGTKVNSTDDEICPSISSDGEIMFFTSRRRGLADIYWISTDIIDKLKQQHKSLKGYYEEKN